MGEPILDTVLHPGDLLYLPRGTIHQVGLFTRSETALELISLLSIRATACLRSTACTSPSPATSSTPGLTFWRNSCLQLLQVLPLTTQRSERVCPGIYSYLFLLELVLLTFIHINMRVERVIPGTTSLSWVSLMNPAKRGTLRRP